jgi:hypothetical protein
MDQDRHRKQVLTALAAAERAALEDKPRALKAHHEAANDFFSKHTGISKRTGITVDDSPEAKALIRERFNTGTTVDDLLPTPKSTTYTMTMTDEAYEALKACPGYGQPARAYDYYEGVREAICSGCGGYFVVDYKGQPVPYHERKQL